MKSKLSEVFKAIGIILALPVSVIMSAAFGPIVGLIFLMSAIFFILVAVPAPEGKAERISTADKVIYLAISLLLVLLAISVVFNLK